MLLTCSQVHETLLDLHPFPIAVPGRIQSSVLKRLVTVFLKQANIDVLYIQNSSPCYLPQKQQNNFKKSTIDPARHCFGLLQPIKIGRQTLITICTKTSKRRIWLGLFELLNKKCIFYNGPQSCRARYHYLLSSIFCLSNFSRLVIHINLIILYGDKWTNYEIEGMYKCHNKVESSQAIKNNFLNAQQV